MKFNKEFEIPIEDDNINNNQNIPKIEPGTSIDGSSTLREIESKPKPIFTVVALLSGLDVNCAFVVSTD